MAMRQEDESNTNDASIAELVSYIFETQRNSMESVVFRLADLIPCMRKDFCNLV